MFLHMCVILFTGGVSRPRPSGRLGGLSGEGCPDPGLGGVYPSMHWGRYLPPSPADGYCCGWFASYWNAFLLLYYFSSVSPPSSFSSLPQMLLLFTLIEANLWVTISCWKLFVEQFYNRYKSDTLVKILMDDFYIWLWSFDVKCIDFTSHMLC